MPQVTSLSSEAFRPLLSLRRLMEEKNGSLLLCGLSPMVRQAFTATRLLSSGRSSTATFEVQPDVSAAIASLQPAES